MMLQLKEVTDGKLIIQLPITLTGQQRSPMILQEWRTVLQCGLVLLLDSGTTTSVTLKSTTSARNLVVCRISFIGCSKTIFLSAMQYSLKHF